MQREEFKKLLEENSPCVTGKNLWIWGAGNTAQLYHEGLTRLAEEGFSFEGYCDNNQQKWGKEFNGRPVISPAELQEKNNVCVLICSVQPKVIREVKVQLKELGLDYYLLDEVILKNHADIILECYDMLDDEVSKEHFSMIAKCRILGISPDIWEDRRKDYFAISRFDNINPNEVFVDCGAYVGDTLEKLIYERTGMFKKLIAFEPNAKNYACMEVRFERLMREWGFSKDAFELYQKGVGSKKSSALFETCNTDPGTWTRAVEVPEGETDAVEVISLDEVLNEKVTFIKADIESYEYNMLIGAQNIIRQYKPLLAICIYHSVIDFYTIQLLIKKIDPTYHFAIRHHRSNLAQTILYAWSETNS